MKSNVSFWVTLCIFGVFLLGTITAVDFEVKNSYQPGETLIARLSGVFIDAPTKADIYLYRDNQVRVSFPADLIRLGDEWYIFGNLPLLETNYSIRIEDVSYKQGTQTLEKDLEKNFTITGETADFAVTPGAILLNAKEFEVTLQNLIDSTITVSISVGNTSTSNNFFKSLFGSIDQKQSATVDIRPGDSKQLFLTLTNATQNTKTLLTLSSKNTKYGVPVYVITNTSSPDTKENVLEFDRESLNIKLATNSNSSVMVYLRNFGDRDVKNISLTVSSLAKPFVKVTPNNISTLKANSSAKILIAVDSDSEPRTIEGQISARDNDSFYAYLPFTAEFSKDFVPSKNNSVIPVSPKRCSELSGSFCAENQVCSGDSVTARDGLCCTGVCQDTQTNTVNLKIFGWVLIICVVVFVGWFFLKKYRGSKSSSVDLLKFLKR